MMMTTTMIILTFMILMIFVSDDDDSEEDDSYADVLNLISDMSVQHSRGLPPPPCGAVIMRDNPPPSPKEMYTQAGIYDVIPGEKVKHCEPQRTVAFNGAMCRLQLEF